MFWVLGWCFSMQHTQMWHVYRCKHVYSILLLQSDAWSKWVQDIFHEFEMNMQGSLSDVDLFVSNELFGHSTWMVKFSMNHRGLGPRGWRIISRVAGVLLVIPQRSAGDPNQQPTTDGSRYLKILRYIWYISCWMLGVRSFWKAEYHYKNHPFDSTCHIDGIWGWSLAVPWGSGRFRKSVDVVKRCKTTKWFDSQVDYIALVLNWASMIVSAPTPKSEYESTGFWRFWKVPCKFHAQLIDSNLISWLPWKS